LGRRARRRLRTLAAEFSRLYPNIGDAAAHISAHGVFVDGQLVDNPRTLIREGARIALRVETSLRGEAKLRFALSTFQVSAAGRVALDLGAAAGGFTRVLLESGASRVYAVDAGHGQLLGSLRQDPRVVALERMNLGDLDAKRIPQTVDLITIDLSYLAVSEAVPQLEVLRIGTRADLIALVKPMFELGLARAPTDRAQLDGAVDRAKSSLERCCWRVAGAAQSPVHGTRGAVEFLVHARRAASSTVG
jgi:23S rRNA (cytidine1920-2'-O)/16S rRNA (cytidine1409-2'-O)-methyltransferase